MAAMNVQHEIRARCGRVVLLTATAAGVAALAGGGGPLRLPLAVASGGVVAGTWAHRILKPVSRAGSSRASRTVAALRQLPTLLPLALVLILSGGAAAWARLAPLTARCSKYEGTCLQEQNLLLLFVGLLNGFIFFMREFALSEPGVKFPLVQQKKFIRIKFAVSPTIIKAINATLTTLPIVALTYYWNGTLIRSSLINLFGLQQEEQTLDGLFSIISFPLLIKICYHSFLFYFITYFTIELFDVYLTERFTFPIEKFEDYLTLSNGIRNHNVLLAKLASRDFLTLARKDLMRRKCIFSLSIPGGHPTNWRNISGSCLDTINSYADRVNAVTQTVKAEPELKISHKNSTPPQLHSYLTSPKLQNNSLRNLSTTNQPPNPQEKTFKEAVKEELDVLLITLCNKPGISFFFGELSEVKLKQLTNDGDAVGKISLGLSQLVAASLTEDPFGIVQDDLSTILQTLMRLKLSLDKLTKSGVINKKNLKHDRAVMESLTDIKSAMRRSIYLIRITFKDHINNIVIDSDTSIALQSFIDFREC